MKKAIILTTLTSILLAAGSVAMAKSTLPGFQDNFNVAIYASSITPTIETIDTKGGIVAENLSCDETGCHFSTTDHDSGDAGVVTMRVGDPTGPYCDLTVIDGAWQQSATVDSSCHNGAKASDTTQNAHEYNLSMFMDSKA